MTDNNEPITVMAGPLLPALTTIPYFNTLEVISRKEPLAIENPVVVVVNPVAGCGRAASFAAEMHRELYRMTSSGRLRLYGDIIFLESSSDPVQRTERIVETLRRLDPSRPPIVISLGGDGTAANVMEALLKMGNGGEPPFLIPGPGGTANDLRKNQGFSAKPSRFIEQLARAVPADLDVVTVSINDGPARILLHSQSTGASGGLFESVHGRLARLRAEGTVTQASGMTSYLLNAPFAVFDVQPFKARAFLDGAEIMIRARQIGEVVVTANTTSLGGIVKIPQPMDGARVHFVPIAGDLPGPAKLVPSIVPVGDVLSRAVRRTLGDQTPIAPGQKITFLPDVADVEPGSKLRIQFYDMNGETAALRGGLNGDPLNGDIRTLEIETSRHKMQTLAVEGSDLLVQRGLAVPKNIMHTAMRAVNAVIETVNRYGTIAAIAGYEVFKDSGRLDEAHKGWLDMGLISMIFGSDIYLYLRYGSQLLLGEMPLMIPFYEIGYEAVSFAMDKASKVGGASQLGEGRTGNKVAAIAGGFAATYAAMRAFGLEVWKASAQVINRYLIETAAAAAEKAGAGIAGFLAGAIQALRGLVSFPVLILPGVTDGMERKDDRYL